MNLKSHIYRYGDEVYHFENQVEHCGCADLLHVLTTRTTVPRVHIFGHVHEGYGTMIYMLLHHISIIYSHYIYTTRCAVYTF